MTSNELVRGLRLLLVVGAMVIWAGAQPLGQDPGRTPQTLDVGGELIEGTWILDILNPTGQTITQALITFNRGGGLTNDSFSPNPTLRSPWHGTWVRTGFRQFLMIQVRGAFDSAGNPTARIKARDLITVNETGDEYTGQFIQDTFDVFGNLTATVRLGERAKRLVVEPVQ